MAHVEVLSRKEDGTPDRLAVDNGFCQYTKTAEPEDMYVDKLLNPNGFLACQLGSEVHYLIDRVNRLERENARLTAESERWRKACGY